MRHLGIYIYGYIDHKPWDDPVNRGNRPAIFLRASGPFKSQRGEASRRGASQRGKGGSYKEEGEKARER